MSFLSTQTLKKVLKADGVVPFDATRLKHGAYEPAVGSEMILTSGTGKIDLSDKRQVPIPPGQLATVLTAETIKIPTNHIGFISLRSSKKREGLINVSGFHVDPGYHGKLTFTLYNAGIADAFIQQGDIIFSLWLSELDSADNSPYTKPGVTNITTELASRYSREWPSPSKLEKDINDTKKTLAVTFGLAASSFGIIVSSLLVNKFDHSITKEDIRTLTQQRVQESEKALTENISQQIESSFEKKQHLLEASFEKQFDAFKKEWNKRSVAGKPEKTANSTKTEQK
jgi:dCTP deaminase